MIDEAALGQTLDELSAALGGHEVAVPAAVKPCDLWKTIRPLVLQLISFLNAAGVLIPKAKLAAQALDTLRGLLDNLCQITASAGTAIGSDPLAAELARAVHPGLSPQGETELPCATWRRVRPIVITIVAELRNFAKEFPRLAQIADAIDAIGKLLDQLCGTQSGSTLVAQLGIMAGSAPLSVSHAAGARRKKVRNCIKYPGPQWVHPSKPGPFKVADLCRDYHFPTGLAGGGQIGILEMGGGYKQSDLDKFSSLNGLPTIQVTDRLIGGTNTTGGPADAEVLLDIQVAAAVYFYCTGAMPKINVYFAPNAGESFITGMQAAVADGCDVLSISWASDESAWPLADAQLVDNAAQAASQAGCIIFAASGDNSSSEGSPGANVDMPSSCPYVVGCGGTTKLPADEVVWGNGTPDGYGTGGGISLLFPLPGWQLGVPPVIGKRMVPDVAADADPATGYLVVINGQETPIGGTSAVAPLYAGLFAAFGRKLGFVTPKLWKNPGAFQDIVKGSNGSFSATYGPDPCTGLGVPIGDALAALFVK